MSGRIRIIVRDGIRETYHDTLVGPVEMGRQDSFEPEPVAKTVTDQGSRLVIAYSRQTSISRRLLRVTPNDDGTVKLENLSTKNYVELHGSSFTRLEPHSSCRMELPVEARVDNLGIVLKPHGESVDDVESFGWQLTPPTTAELASLASRTVMFSDCQEELPAELFAWLKDAMQMCMKVFQSAMSSDAFFHEGARAVVNIANMDSGQVLLRAGDSWSERTRYPADSDEPGSTAPSQRVLHKVLTEKRTCWQLPHGGDDLRGSFVNISAVVAAPILNNDREVIGVLYADRRLRDINEHAHIKKLEALLVELLACGIATGLARLDSEKAQVKYEQFFTPNLAKRLIDEPELLAGNDRPISIMFCDITGFSEIGESLDPSVALEWIHDALTRFSACVLQSGGVLVDYVGDELMAMWGAPDPVDDHAERACRAAVEIMRSLPELNARWESAIGAATSVCIGINSGVARVGNTGSKQKFKYGALGNTVNLASRVQSASKHLRTRLIVAEETSRQLPAAFQRRRLCQVRVKGIAAPVHLYELCNDDCREWGTIQQEYEAALAMAEQGELRRAITSLGNLLQVAPDDGPTLVLLARLVEAIHHGRQRLDSVWELPGK